MILRFELIKLIIMEMLFRSSRLRQSGGPKKDYIPVFEYYSEATEKIQKKLLSDTEVRAMTYIRRKKCNGARMRKCLIDSMSLRSTLQTHATTVD